MPCDTATSLLDIYSMESKSAYLRDTCIPMFITVLFIISNLWNQYRCLSTIECGIYTCTKNVVYVHNGALFSHKKEQNHVVCKRPDGTGDHIKQNKSVSEDKNHMFSLICGI
jgi:hypothetical protein